MVALSEMGDSSTGDATDSDTMSVSLEDPPTRLPAWAHALMDQVTWNSAPCVLRKCMHAGRCGIHLAGHALGKSVSICLVGPKMQR